MKDNQKKVIKILEKSMLTWHPSDIEDTSKIQTGDMPGDQIKIETSHIDKAHLIMPELLKLLETNFKQQEKVVVSVCGGSGVGKSETGSLLGYFLSQMGIGTYILSGDNYPHRIPHFNDAERERVYRQGGLKGLKNSNSLTQEVNEVMRQLWKDEKDADSTLVTTYPWLSVYQTSGVEALKAYLGTPNEINFDEINAIIHDFKSGKETIYLKRMGRTINDLWYDAVSFIDTSVLIIEWTHGNNDYLEGVDIPILLNSTPEETLAHRLKRNRDGKTDSAFTTTVLNIEQKKLMTQAKRAALIVTKSGQLISYEKLIQLTKQEKMSIGPMFNAYPDSIGSRLSGSVDLLTHPKVKGAFESFYILPSLFNTDLDRGFSVIDYDLNQTLVSKDDIEKLSYAGINLKLDFILNHASVLSPQFQDLLKHGQKSKYKDFFINWNDFWAGCGPIKDGVLIPDASYTDHMFFRKPGLPILKVTMPNGESVPYWNTFYQQVYYPSLDPQDMMKLLHCQYNRADVLSKKINESLKNKIKLEDIELDVTDNEKHLIQHFMEKQKKYLGQMDLNIQSPLVWEFYEDTLKKLSDYGAQIVRLDAFAYAPKAPGKRNFLNDPETWEVLSKVNNLAKGYGLRLLPEIHAMYHERIHNKIAKQGYMTYDFFLPGLIIDAFERKDTRVLKNWIQEILDDNIQCVNMLGCHDGIPLLDLKGLLPDEQIQKLIDIVVERGGYVKDLHGKKNMYYQVNATYYSALGEKDHRLLLARALQIFTPGKPQVWYLDLFGGKNDYDAVKAAGHLGHKEINRTNILLEDCIQDLDSYLVSKQLELLKFRNQHPVFNKEAWIELMDCSDHELKIKWSYEDASLMISIDFNNETYEIIE